MHLRLYLYPNLGVPVVPVLITLIVDLAGGSDPGNDIIIRREDELSVYANVTF